MISTLADKTSHITRPSWQCRFADGQCTNPRVTMITGHVHNLCEEHRTHKTPSTRRVLECDPDDWEYQPMNGGDWTLTAHDLARDDVCEGQGRGAAVADDVVFGSMLFHADVEALYVCR